MFETYDVVLLHVFVRSLYGLSSDDFYDFVTLGWIHLHENFLLSFVSSDFLSIVHLIAHFPWIELQ